MSNIRILKKATCPSLSNKTTLSYHIGQDKDTNIFLRINNNTGGGHFNPSWINLKAMLDLIIAADTPFSRSILAAIFKGQSNNTSGFIMAVLLKEKIIKNKDKQYESCNWENALNRIKELSKKEPRRRK